MYVLRSDGEIPLLFSEMKEFSEQSPTYYALYEPSINLTVLCRALAPDETTEHFDKKSKKYSVCYLSNDDVPGHKTPCLLLSKVKSIEQADQIIASYRDGLARMKEYVRERSGNN